MTCRNCGYQNRPDDAFCGSCGQFLRYADEPAEEASEATEQRYETRRDSGSRRQRDEPPLMARRAAPGVVSGAVTCWNCGRRNPTSRAFCQQCGERLSIGSLAYADMARPQSNWAKLFAAGLGLIAVVLLAVLGVVFLFGGDAPVASPTPTSGAIATASPSPIATPTITAAPTLSPTPPPTAEPTLAPTEQPTQPASPPPPTPANCSASSFPTAWVNLTGGETRARVRREQIWCIHQVIVVPDPNFGEGIIRLLIGNTTLVEVGHTAGSSSAEYPFAYSPAQLVPSRTDVTYSMTCASGNFCSAIVQVGYELIETP